MELHNIQKLKINRLGDDLVRVVITKDDVKHVSDKATLEECFDSMERLLNSEDYPKKLAAYKAAGAQP